ncbi:hypothetical protein GCM10025876_24890 [Demequina litorisediminis]|uniref:Uncharacterized protein n=1 Tax=Demequina litorisediminis TaxID=1849022 RepID=A0ABQ6IG61_9MICO|nr:hypothetical protein GCM10025876_24890 [Demequina litorisediminis]
MLGEKVGSLVIRNALGGRDERHGCHGLADLERVVLGVVDEAKVAVGDDAEQAPVLVDHGEAGDAVLAAQGVEAR